ncbi:hypothetical protein K438DRAFT_1959016 [Mycena galopus ATCC 62051]|nr:hypothetical protein K438DRAFT_1959016 [Mycena galopus ATCC 62051]
MTQFNLTNNVDSDIIHLNVAGTSITILSSQHAVEELLEKTSAMDSDRLARRKVVQNVLHPTVLPGLHSAKLSATHELLRRTLQDPDHVLSHARHIAGRLIMAVTYRIDVSSEEDPHFALGEAAVNALVIAGIPGRFLIDTFPILKYVPEWVPGAGFERTARFWKELAGLR